jgi:hypothetical protein
LLARRNSGIDHMNIFGSFTFGSLIKTFLPGMVWLLALGVLETDISRLLQAEPFLLTLVRDSAQVSLVLAIGFPAAILLGLMSNIVVFMGVNDWLVRTPVKQANADLFSLYDRLAARIRDRCWPSAGSAVPGARRVFDEHTDVEIIMLASVDQDKVTHVREQYWYHLEFQLNLLLSLVALFVGATVNACLKAGSACYGLLQLLAYLAVFVPIWIGLLKAARKNYSRHVSKMLSLMAGILAG